MIPISLSMVNFMNHRKTFIDFSTFQKALIVAKSDKDPRVSNGLGKTTVISAIEYAIFGEVPTSTLDKVVHDNQKKCDVKFSFELDGCIYRIERATTAKGKSNLKFYQVIDGKDVPLHGNRVPETKAEIAKTIKISHKAFSHAIKFGQRDISQIAAEKTSDKRKAILKEPLNLQIYSKLEKQAKEKMTVINKDVQALEAVIESLGDPKAEIVAAESELKFSSSEIDSKKATILKLSKSIDSKRESLESLKKMLSSSDTEIHDKISQLGKRSKELKNIIESSNERVQSSSDEIKKQKAKLASLRKTQAELEAKLSKFDENNLPDADDLYKKLDKVSNDEIVGVKLLAKLEAEFDQANKTLPNGDICSACMQPITKEHRDSVEQEVNKVLEEKAKQIKHIKTNLTKCKNKKDSLKKQHAQALKTISEYKDAKQAKQRLINDISSSEEYIQAAEKRMNVSDAEVKTARNELETVGKDLETLKDSAKKSNVAELNNKIFSATDELRVYERSLENVNDELHKAQERFGSATARMDSAKKNLEKLNKNNKQLKDKKYQQKIGQIGTHAFSSGGIPTNIIYSVVNELQSETNSWLSEIRPDLGIQFDAELNLIFTVSGREKEWSQLSTGQQMYVTLAIKIGLSRIIQKKVGTDIRFMLLDEVDQSLDASGVEAYQNIMRKLENDFKLLVVTHNDELKDSFSHAILVEGNTEEGVNGTVVSSW